MSVLIKGMEMPTSRGEYVLRLYVDSDRTATVEGVYSLLKGEPFEAVTVPEHGRLIDANALEPDTDWWHGCDGYTAFSRCAIECAPTIIEAEPYKEKGE